jgi:hypothetical protein
MNSMEKRLLEEQEAGRAALARKTMVVAPVTQEVTQEVVETPAEGDKARMVSLEKLATMNFQELRALASDFGIKGRGADELRREIAAHLGLVGVTAAEDEQADVVGDTPPGVNALVANDLVLEAPVAFEQSVEEVEPTSAADDELDLDRLLDS